MFRNIKYVRILICLIMVTLSVGCSGSNPVQHTEHMHSYTTAVTEPNCTEDGYTLFTCSCGDSFKGELVPALGHSYETSVVPATYLSEGYTQYLCGVCGDAYKDGYMPKLSEVVSSLAEKDYLLPFEDFSRAREHDPEFVMIHFTSAVVLSQEDPFNHSLLRGIFTDYELSVHYIIDRDGVVRCYIPEELVAYHAGAGTWADDPKYTNRLNDYAIGIEIMAIGSQSDMAQYLSPSAYRKLKPEDIGFTDAQYEALKVLVQDICQRNDIPMDRQHIIGHEEYSPAKTDPGELFDWERLFS